MALREASNTFSQDAELVCAKCGGDRIDVKFTAHGSGAAYIGVNHKGEPYLDYVEDKHYDDFDHELFRCADCHASWYPLAKGVTTKQQAGINLNPGDLVILPDGFKATVAAVDTEENTFTVERWHETFKAGEATPLQPMARAAA